MKDRLVSLGLIALVLAFTGFVAVRDYHLLRGDVIWAQATVVDHYQDAIHPEMGGAVYRFETPDGRAHRFQGQSMTRAAPPAIGSTAKISYLRGQPDKANDAGLSGLLLMNGLALLFLTILVKVARFRSSS